MNKIRADAKKSPFAHIIIISLLSVGIVSLPLERLFVVIFGDSYALSLSVKIFIRLVLFAAAAIFIHRYGFGSIFKNRPSLISLAAVFPALIVAVNNFPIVAFAENEAAITGNPLQIALYATYCLSVGLFEESVFRGLVFPLSLKITEKKKYGVFWAAALSSAVFGGVHFVNLFAGMGIGAVALQVAYSFLLGGMCAAALLFTGNIFAAVALHAIFDFGGLIFDGAIGIASGFQWDPLTVALTAVIGVIVFTYMLTALLSFGTDKAKALFKSDGFWD